ncbi:ABC transporter permease [Candidatus Phycosocius spiralis]|uniref:ABC transporter permease n=1 Tax=Candidatus Phycosocius spiralis TaxID=2815099 RepID=A0ABQ4PWE0_9PROT|nr:ABC transporter permease [Candidatus Phycosocius spiralis]GIU67372.1 ABC transporter permease [Candidatus Phycosocius spiralis]
MSPLEAQFSIVTSSKGPVLRVSGDWTIHTIGALDARLRVVRGLNAHRPAIVDVAQLKDLDTAGAYAIEKALASSLESPAILIGDHPVAGRMLGEVRKHTQGRNVETRITSSVHQFLEHIGRSVVQIYDEMVDTLGFLGETIVACWRAILNPSSVRWLPTFAVAESAGVNAVPIVMTLSFFIGSVLAFLGKTILQDFGASIFTIELVGFAVLREFGVLITAIILAGRSDSSFTAQIGSMKMTQEIDALRILGMNPMDMLVVPRVIALLVMFPILTFLAMLAGIAGGALVTVLTLDLSLTLFFTRLTNNVGVDQFWAGMAKAPVFAIIIAIIGCRQGLNVANNVISLGQRTTASVVQALFMVIVVEAVFALIYMELGI